MLRLGRFSVLRILVFCRSCSYNANVPWSWQGLHAKREIFSFITFRWSFLFEMSVLQFWVWIISSNTKQKKWTKILYKKNKHFGKLLIRIDRLLNNPAIYRARRPTALFINNCHYLTLLLLDPHYKLSLSALKYLLTAQHRCLYVVFSKRKDLYWISLCTSDLKPLTSPLA